MAKLRVLPPTYQTCLATNQVVAVCEKLLQNVENSSTYCNKICICWEFYRPAETTFAAPEVTPLYGVTLA